jgi:hypothetical protein
VSEPDGDEVHRGGVAGWHWRGGGGGVAQVQSKDGCAHLVLEPAFCIGQPLAEEEFRSALLPRILSWLECPDNRLRAGLLQKLGVWVSHCDQATVSNQVFPHLRKAFEDKIPQMRELAVKSVPQIIDKLEDRIVNGPLIQSLAALLQDRAPALRVNTMILLVRGAGSAPAPALLPSVGTLPARPCQR